MSNDLDLYGGGDLQPYSPSQPLAPSPADNWGNTDVDYLGGSQQHQTAPQLFGNPLPPGSTPQDAERAISMIAGSYMASMANWGHPASLINAAVQWLNTAATQPPRREQRRHSYELHSQAGDPVAESFANYMVRFNASQEFVSNSIYFIEELERQQSGQQVTEAHDQAPAQGRATSSTADWENSLSEAEYNALVDYNDKQKARTEDILRAKWKDSYLANIRMVDSFVAGLSAVEKAALDTYTNTGLHALNDPYIIEQLYLQAIGGGSLPTSGAALQDEIEACHRCMREQPKKWRADERLQGRYRHLLTLRGY